MTDTKYQVFYYDKDGDLDDVSDDFTTSKAALVEAKQSVSEDGHAEVVVVETTPLKRVKLAKKAVVTKL